MSSFLPSVNAIIILTYFVQSLPTMPISKLRFNPVKAFNVRVSVLHCSNKVDSSFFSELVSFETDRCENLEKRKYVILKIYLHSGLDVEVGKHQ